MANISCTEAAELIAEVQGASCKSPRERILLEIGLLWKSAANYPSSRISCEQASSLISEASNAGCKSPRERRLLEIGLLWEASILGGTVDITADNTVISADSTIITADMTEFI
jgi:hypothetical protein